MAQTAPHDLAGTPRDAKEPHSPRAARSPGERPHALVIGSGFGGLAAAVRLGARGYRVTVVDRRDQAGGRAYVYRQDGFVFDGGPTVVTAPFLFEELWQLCGKRLSDHVDLRPVTPFYRIRFDDGALFDYTGDAAAMREQIGRFAPGDVAGYERFLRRSEAIFQVGFEQLAHVPFGTWTSMAKIAPAMMRLESFRTVYSLVAKYVKDERIRQVLSFHPLLVGGNPFSTTSIYTLIAFLERKWGVWFPMGGTGALVSGLVDLIEGQGGSVRLSTEVKKITVERGRATGVELASGELALVCCLAACAPQPALLAAGGSSRAVLLLDVRSRESLLALRGHSGGVLGEGLLHFRSRLRRLLRSNLSCLGFCRRHLRRER
jgi:phytoene desaturase